MRMNGSWIAAVMVLAMGLALQAPAQDADAEAVDSPLLTVAEIGVGTGYDRETRQLVGEAVVFPAGTEQLWCRTRITGAETPTTVTHVWYNRGKTLARVELAVGSPDWRTVSSKQLMPDWTGDWEVKVLDAAGNVLASLPFTVQ